MDISRPRLKQNMVCYAAELHARDLETNNCEKLWLPQTMIASRLILSWALSSSHNYPFMSEARELVFSETSTPSDPFIFVGILKRAVKPYQSVWDWPCLYYYTRLLNLQIRRLDWSLSRSHGAYRSTLICSLYLQLRWEESIVFLGHILIKFWSLIT